MRKLFNDRLAKETLGELRRRFLEARERDGRSVASDEVAFSQEAVAITQHERCGGGRRVLRKRIGAE